MPLPTWPTQDIKCPSGRIRTHGTLVKSQFPYQTWVRMEMVNNMSKIITTCTGTPNRTESCGFGIHRVATTLYRQIKYRTKKKGLEFLSKSFLLNIFQTTFNSNLEILVFYQKSYSHHSHPN